MGKSKTAPDPVVTGAGLRAIDPNHVPLFKGATRVATIKGGVPVRAFLYMCLGVGWLAMFNIGFLGLIAVLYPIMAIISRNDSRAFWIIELWMKTSLFARNKRYWGAVSFTPRPYQRRRSWCRNKDS